MPLCFIPAAQQVTSSLANDVTPKLLTLEAMVTTNNDRLQQQLDKMVECQSKGLVRTAANLLDLRSQKPSLLVHSVCNEHMLWLEIRSDGVGIIMLRVSTRSSIQSLTAAVCFVERRRSCWCRPCSGFVLMFNSLRSDICCIPFSTGVQRK